MRPNVQVNRQYTFSGHRDCVYTVVEGPAPSEFFSGSGDGMVVQWTLENPNQGKLVARLPNSVYALHYDRDTEELYIGHNYEGLHVIYVPSGEETASLKLGTAAFFDIKKNGNDIIMADGNGELTIVDRPSMAVRKRVKIAEKSARVIAMPNQRDEFAVGYSDNSIKIFSASTYEPRKVIHHAHKNSVFALSYTADSKFLVSGSRDAHFKVWAADHDYKEHAAVVGHMYAINSMAFHPEGRYFATCSLDKSIKVWRTEDFRLLKVIDKSRHAGHGTSVNKLIWLNYSNKAYHNPLVSASDDRSISVWDVQVHEP